MNRKALESLDKEALIDLVLTLAARVAELEAKLGLPPKTPDNSGTPPSAGRKASGESMAKAKSRPHPGTSRALHPNPTRTREVRAASARSTTKGEG